MSTTTIPFHRLTDFRSPSNPHGLRFLEGEDGGGGDGSAASSTGGSDEGTDAESGDAADGDPEGSDALGDPGKKALDTMKAARNEARAEAAELRKELDALKAQIEGREAEHAAAVEAQRIKDEALAAANLKITKANLRAEAAGKLADPTDALTFIDASSFEVDDDGNVDQAALAAAIDELIQNKPYLAAQGKRFQGDADGGARKDTTKAQVTRDELSRMTPEEINTARAEGRLNDLLGVQS